MTGSGSAFLAAAGIIAGIAAMAYRPAARSDFLAPRFGPGSAPELLDFLRPATGRLAIPEFGVIAEDQILVLIPGSLPGLVGFDPLRLTPQSS
jgi:hypothetical protein